MTEHRKPVTYESQFRWKLDCEEVELREGEISGDVAEWFREMMKPTEPPFGRVVCFEPNHRRIFPVGDGRGVTIRAGKVEVWLEGGLTVEAIRVQNGDVELTAFVDTYG